MVLQKLTERIKKAKTKMERMKAKAHGMTVPELRQHLRKRKTERRAFKAELKRMEREERQKFEKWKITQKYKQKRKATKEGKPGGALGLIMDLGGPGKASKDGDPLGIFSGQKKQRTHKKRKKKEWWEF